jgi:hypothetical protein
MSVVRFTIGCSAKTFGTLKGFFFLFKQSSVGVGFNAYGKSKYLLLTRKKKKSFSRNHQTLLRILIGFHFYVRPTPTLSNSDRVGVHGDYQQRSFQISQNV